MPDRGEWEVCFYSEAGDYEVRSMFVASERRARRLMLKTFRKDDAFYCATISNDPRSAFEIYYWNGRRLIAWDKPWLLPCRQARGLEPGGGRGDAKDY